MKRLLILTALAIFATGCSSTKIWTYDKDGKIATYQETNTDIAGSITLSTKDKTIIATKNGWAAYGSVSMSTTDDPTPTGKFWGGKYNDFYVSIHKDHVGKDMDWAGLAKVIAASNKSLTISTNGAGESSVE